MSNQIDRILNSHQTHHIMNHIVAGYPSLAGNETIVESMTAAGTGLLEIQIPFSDPMADGNTILKANHDALRNGTSIDDSFFLARTLKDRFDLAIVLMTYANIPFKLGFESFITRCSQSGVDGVIIPDLPFDSEFRSFFLGLKKANIHPIFVVSPRMDPSRLTQILSVASGFIYATLKVGITGERKTVERSGLDFLTSLRQQTALPIAAGFGISTVLQVQEIENYADISVIGSHMINLYNQKGVSGISSFIKACRHAVP